MTYDKLERVQLKYILIIGAILAFFFPLVFYNYDIRAGDTAKYIQNPLHVLAGEKPYVDFWTLFPPGEVYVPAGIYSLFGKSMHLLFGFSWLIGAGIFIFSFLITYEWRGRKDVSLLTAALVFFSGVSAHYAGYDYAGGQAFLLLLLASLYLILKYRHSESKFVFFAIGCLLAIAAWLRLYESGAFVAALLVFAFFKRREVHNIRRKIIMAAAGFLILSFILYIPFLKMLPTVFEETVIKPPRHATAYTLSYFETTQAFFAQSFAQLAAGSYVSAIITLFRAIYDLIYQLIPLTFLVASLFWLTRKNSGENDHTHILFFALWSLFSIPKTIAVPDVHYLSHAVTPLLFTIPFFFSLIRKENKMIRYILIIAITLLLVSVPLSKAANTIHNLRSETYYIKTDLGQIPFKDKAVVENVTAVINNVYSNTKIGDSIFVVPYYTPPLYFLTGRHNPTYYDSLLDFQFLPAVDKQKELCKELVDRNVSLVVTAKCIISKTETENCQNPGFEVLQACIAQNFEYNATYNPYIVYVKNNI